MTHNKSAPAKNRVYARTLVLGLVLLSGACATGQQSLTQMTWSHPEKDQQAFYHDDAKCLEQSNALLAEQLEAARNDKSICILPDAGKQLHRQCMEGLGWRLNQ